MHFYVESVNFGCFEMLLGVLMTWETCLVTNRQTWQLAIISFKIHLVDYLLNVRLLGMAWVVPGC